MVSFVLRKTRRGGEFSRDLCGGHAWNEKRNRAGVFFEKCTVTHVEFPLFAAHDGKIEDCKVNQEKQSGDPGARGNSGAQGPEQNTAQRRARKQQYGNRERVAETNTPANEEAAGRAHARASTCRRTASKTAATSISSMEGSICSRRL